MPRAIPIGLGPELGDDALVPLVDLDEQQTQRLPFLIIECLRIASRLVLLSVVARGSRPVDDELGMCSARYQARRSGQSRHEASSAIMAWRAAVSTLNPPASHRPDLSRFWQLLGRTDAVLVPACQRSSPETAAHVQPVPNPEHQAVIGFVSSGEFKGGYNRHGQTPSLIRDGSGS